MSFEEFRESLKNDTPPPHLSDLLRALWYDGQGDWTTSHNIAQDIHSKEGSWIHAYLHRKEGDDGNAGYWYGRAGKKLPERSLEAEWEELVREFL